MAKRYLKKIENVVTPADSNRQQYMMYTDSDDSREKAMKAMSGVIDSYSGSVRSSSARASRMGFDPSNIGGSGISGRESMTHEGYEAWRPGERSRFSNSKDTIIASDMCYKRHGLIKNVIDLMGDFASQGIRLVHPNKKIERFYKKWFKKVNGEERSERFLNNFYRLGNVVVRFQTARINAKTEQKLYRATGKPDLKITKPQVEKKEIPWKYVFLHPATIEIVGGQLANFIGNPEYQIKLPSNVARIIQSPKNEGEKRMVDQLPDEIKQAAKNRSGVKLPSEKTRVFHYKKDDWQDWADPMIASILIDVSLYEKLKLADRAALDGAISNIRIFRLGSLEHKIVPDASAAEKLASILESNVEAGTLDLIWGPDIDLLESKTNVHEFLGKEKYEPTLIAIYAGLGIPPTLTGTFGAAGTTNNFISLKTLTQRLEYGRDALVKFWEEQIALVQEAMGFRLPASIEFNTMNLGDEAGEKALLIQLADRNIISDEAIQRHFGHSPDMERIRINRQETDRSKGNIPPKAGAFHSPTFEDTLKRVFAQTGVVTPSELGIELKPKKKGEKSALTLKQTNGPSSGVPGKPPSDSPDGQSGRPKNADDSGERKQRTFKPRVKASLEIWAYAAQEVIAEHLNPILLKQFGKSNLRGLTSDEVEKSEDIKFGVLSNLEPLSSITEKEVLKALSNKPKYEIISACDTLSKQVSHELDRKLTLDERKRIQSTVYAACKGEL